MTMRAWKLRPLDIRQVVAKHSKTLSISEVKSTLEELKYLNYNSKIKNSKRRFSPQDIFKKKRTNRLMKSERNLERMVLLYSSLESKLTFNPKLTQCLAIKSFFLEINSNYMLLMKVMFPAQLKE